MVQKLNVIDRLNSGYCRYQILQKRAIECKSIKLLFLLTLFGLVLSLLAWFFFIQRERLVSAAGPVIKVKANGDLQRALDLAKPGAVIELEAGAVFKGPFVLPVKPGAEYITIRSSRLSELPSSGKRVLPEHANLMPRILATASEPAIRTARGAHHWKIIGIEITTERSSPRVSDLVRLGDGSASQNSLASVPHHLTLDRCYIHGHPHQEVKRGVALNSGETSIINSYISEIHGIGYDTQAICGWNGPGPYHIINNHLEAAGENMMFGGADPAVLNLVPSDIEVRRNTFFKPLSWKVGHPSYSGYHWTVKNLFELKNSRRVIIDGNVFENNWADAQVGFAILFKSINQDGNCGWCVTEDVTFSNNIVRNSEHGINVLGNDPDRASGQLKRLRVVNNFWQHINGMWFQGTDGADDILLEHNTHLQRTGNVMTLYGKPTTKFVYRNNLTVKSGSGIKGDGTADGIPSLQTYCPGYVFENNLVIGPRTNSDPPKNLHASSAKAAGLVESEKGIFKLTEGSPFRSKASDGTDPGCDFVQLYRAISNEEAVKTN